MTPVRGPGAPLSQISNFQFPFTHRFLTGNSTNGTLPGYRTLTFYCK